ncbi:MAG: alpha/beta hydrolase [Candidatus Binataceae bacterium]|nr:alpha/beta hydrolase [Candidatus Binataceae bacterium]
MAHKEEMIDLHGSQVQVLSGGSGTPLLYLHSAGGEVAWLPFFEQLSRDFKVYVPAHPGFSKSSGLDKIDSVHDLVFHYVDLMDALGLKTAFVAGLSLGGWIAAELAVHHPERVRKLALMGAVGLYWNGAPKIPDIFAASGPKTRDIIFYDPKSELARAVMPDDPSTEQLELAIKAREATARVGWNPYLYDPRLLERLYRVTMPTLLIWGDTDRLVAIEYAQEYKKRIKDSRLITIEKCGHAPPIERPEPTAKAIAEFFKS